MTKKKFISLIDPRFLNGIAHRGLHDNKEMTENGMKAFENAIKNDLPFEFDIHLTKDNELIVCHDEDLVRTTGKSGIIEDLTLKEIKDNYKLLDGGEIPTLEEVLTLNNERVPMVIELKVFRKNYKPLAKRALETFKTIKDKSKVMIISFDPRSLWPLKNKGFVRSLLIAKSDDYTWMFRHGIESIDIEKVLLDEKKYLRYAKHHFVNVWTIQSDEDLKKCSPFVDTVTFQYLDIEKVKKSLQK